MGVFGQNVIFYIKAEFKRGGVHRKAYLTDGLQGQSKVEPIANLHNSSSGDNMVDTFICVKSQIKQP